MSYEELAATYASLQQMTTFVIVVLLVVGLFVKVAPIGECDKCVHCREERANAVRDTFCPLHRRPRSLCEDQHRD